MRFRGFHKCFQIVIAQRLRGKLREQRKKKRISEEEEEVAEKDTIKIPPIEGPDSVNVSARDRNFAEELLAGAEKKVKQCQKGGVALYLIRSDPNPNVTPPCLSFATRM